MKEVTMERFVILEIFLESFSMLIRRPWVIPKMERIWALPLSEVGIMNSLIGMWVVWEAYFPWLVSRRKKQCYWILVNSHLSNSNRWVWYEDMNLWRKRHLYGNLLGKSNCNLDYLLVQNNIFGSSKWRYNGNTHKSRVFIISVLTGMNSSCDEQLIGSNIMEKSCNDNAHMKDLVRS